MTVYHLRLSVFIGIQPPYVINIRLFMVINNLTNIRFWTYLYLVPSHRWSHNRTWYQLESPIPYQRFGLVMLLVFWIYFKACLLANIIASSCCFNQTVLVLKLSTCNASGPASHRKAWSFVPKHKFVWLESCWWMRSWVIGINQRGHISRPIRFLLFC